MTSTPFAPRLERTSVDVTGVLVSMAGFTNEVKINTEQQAVTCHAGTLDAGDPQPGISLDITPAWHVLTRSNFLSCREADVSMRVILDV
jgi:hypothetical protein